MIVNKLNETLNLLDENEMNYILAKFIKTHMDKIPNMKIDEIAERCFVSKGKVSNFCKEMGYDSFLSLKEDCIKEIKAKKVVAKRQALNLEKQYMCHLEDSFRIIQSNLGRIDLKIVGDFVQDIYNAEHIYLFGVSYSHLLCQYFQNECEILNKDVVVLDEKISRNIQIPKNSILIIITIEGYAFVENHRLLQKIKSIRLKQWCIGTDYISKEISQYFDRSVIISTKNTDLKDRRILVRYFLDILLGRYQHLYLK